MEALNGSAQRAGSVSTFPKDCVNLILNVKIASITGPAHERGWMKGLHKNIM